MLAEKTSHLRRNSRAFALQALYEIDLADHPLEDAIGWLQEEMSLPEEALSFARELIKGALENREVIDGLIQEFAPAWPVSHLSGIDRNVLRLALYEIKFEEGVPRKVAINEAVELAKAFGSESSGRFVNGVLGSVMERLEGDPQPVPSATGRAGEKRRHAR